MHNVDSDIQKLTFLLNLITQGIENNDFQHKKLNDDDAKSHLFESEKWPKKKQNKKPPKNKQTQKKPPKTPCQTFMLPIAYFDLTQNFFLTPLLTTDRLRDDFVFIIYTYTCK